MEMSADALRILINTSQEAKAARVLDIRGDGRTQYVDQNGELTPVVVAPRVRSHHVFSLDDLIVYGGQVAERQSEAPTCVVWHDTDGVVLVLDDSDRRDTVTFELNFSSQFRVLRELAEKRPSMQQQAFVRMLRISLQIDEAIIAIFRKLDWKSTTHTKGETLPDRESLGRSIEAQVQGTSGIPDSIVVPTPIYTNLGEDNLYNVNCLVEFDALNATIQLLPAAGEFERVLDRHQAAIRVRLEKPLQDAKGPRVPIYYGTP